MNYNDIQEQEISLKELLKEYEKNNVEIIYTNGSQHYIAYTQFKEYKINRNDLCPCGSGKKYKKCCLKNNTFENYLTENNNDSNNNIQHIIDNIRFFPWIP